MRSRGKSLLLITLLLSLFLTPSFLLSQEEKQSKLPSFKKKPLSNQTKTNEDANNSVDDLPLIKSTLQKINWKKMKAAAFYRFILKDEDDRILTEKELEVNSIELFLKPGNYYFQVQVYNRFKKLGAKTRWKLFRVLPAIQPVIRSISQSIFYDNQEVLDFTIRVDNAAKDSQLWLNHLGHTIQVTEDYIDFKERRSGNYYQILFPRSLLQNGFYTIIVQNFSGLKSQLINAFELRTSTTPIPKIISLTSGYSSEVYKDIQVSGSGFKKGMQVRLVGNDRIVPAQMIKLHDSQRIEFILNLQGIPHGLYNLVLENPSGDLGTLENAFEVLTYDIASLLDFSFSYKIGGYISPYLAKPQFFYSGTQFRFAFGFGNLAFYDKPFLKDLGVEFELSTWVGPDDDNINSIFLLLTGFNFFWQSNFDAPANIQIKFGSGLTYARMAEGVTDGYYDQQSYTPYIKMGVNGIFEPVDKLLIDIGFAVVPIFYFDRTSWMIEFGVGIGGSL